MRKITVLNTLLSITLGQGKRLFGDGTIPAAFKVTESIVGRAASSN